MKIKFAVITMFLFFGATKADAAGSLYRSSWTATADTLTPICSGGQKAILHTICLNKTAVGSTMTVGNSSFTLTGTTFGVLDGASTPRCEIFDIYLTKGLIYTTASTGDWTITYDCYK